jgi:hypothetical protein
MKMRYRSIFWCSLWFLSVFYNFNYRVFYNFNYRYISKIYWLNLFLNVLFFVAIVNRITFLISFPASSLLVCKNATVFYMLTLYPATWLNSFINFNTFWWGYLGFSMLKIMSSININHLVSYFPVWIPFIYFSWLTFLAKTSCTVSNRMVTWTYLLVPDLRGSTFSFPRSCGMSTGDVGVCNTGNHGLEVVGCKKDFP